jgi:hypothetical protein
MQPENPPPRVLAEARSLVAQGQYQEALAKYLWIHEHSLDFGPAFGGVRLSFALSEWAALGEKYPPARRALLAVRLNAINALENGDGAFSLFHDVAAINRCLRDDAATVHLFELLHQRQPELAKQCYHVAEEVLVDAGEYSTCISYLADPAQRLEEIRQMRQITLEIAQENPALSSQESLLKVHAEMRFDKETRRLIAILEGVGRTKDADHVREVARKISEGSL